MPSYGAQIRSDEHEMIEISVPADAGEVLLFAADELEAGLNAMLKGWRPAASRAEGTARPFRIVFRTAAHGVAGSAGNGLALRREADAIVIEAAGERAVLDGVYQLLERLGAVYPLSAPARFPAITLDGLRAIAPFRVEPAFDRRAFVSDIMTWHYVVEDGFRRHLEHDLEFIPWMARRGINAFFYIRHAQDLRLKISELVPLYLRRGIDAEYGGHVLQLLLPRERFDQDAELFPADENGNRSRKGNLCVSNPRAVALVAENALEYVREHPENRLLHVWGADVFKGAWCWCGECKSLSPQQQYLKIVNAIAGRLADARVSVAYLAYHDTIDPGPGLVPASNAWLEWAPRERCYSHAIDDPACATNPRYWDSLRRYLEIFGGRGHIFEYYGDAILFGGLGFATPATIARDLRAYHSLGLRSVSCLIFGAYSALAYPVNLEAFVRGSMTLDFDPKQTLADVAAERHPECALDGRAAYRAIERASRAILTFGDVMRPPRDPETAARVRVRLREAVRHVRAAIERIADAGPDSRGRWCTAERELWRYGFESLEGMADYIAARDGALGDERRASGEAALKRLDRAITSIRAIQNDVKGTWGSYDIERFHVIWIEKLRQALAA